MAVGETVTYIISFTEDIDAITVMANDFGNFENASYTVGTITESSDTSGVFTVPITPTSVGSFQLQILEGAVIKDMAGNVLDTSTDINDDVTINVIAGANAYAAWAAGPFDGTLSNSDTSLDFDGGGLVTGLEWVLGGDPTLASDDNGIRPTFDASGATNFTFTFRRATAARDDSNTTIAVEYSSDMGFGSEAQHNVDGVSFAVTGNPEPGVEEVTVTIPKSLATGNKMFVRLKVTIASP